MPSSLKSTETVTETLDRLEGVLESHELPGAPDISEVSAAAKRRALSVLGLHGVEQAPQARRGAALFYAADVLAALCIELAAHRERAQRLIAEVAEMSELPRAALARGVLSNPSLLGFPPAVAIEAQLGLVMAFAPLREVSLWMLDPGGDLHAVNRSGEPGAGRSTEELARRLLEGTVRTAKRGTLIGFAVERWGEHAAALVGRPQRGRHDDCLPVLEEAVPMLGATLERERLVSRNVNAESLLSQTHERRLTRLGFDIHDGPLQDLSLLADDLELLRRQLTDVLPEELRPIMSGRVDDLEAQLVALDSDLRRISASLQSPFTRHQTLPAALEEMCRAFAARSGIEPELHLEGELEDLTDSQQLAVLSIVREALSNVREHSEASEAIVTVHGRSMSIEIQVVDNGIGFDVEETLVRAARDGRFGLVGLHERARLLGGASHIESRRGQSTTIAVTLPRWRAVAPEAEAE